MTDQELRELVEKLASSQIETDRHMQETDRRMQETDRRMQETDRRMQETDRRLEKTDKMIRELGRQIGGLGHKFGTFAEGLAYSSIERILKEDFGLSDFITPYVNMSKGGRHEEYDILAYSNGAENKGMIVEVKSKLRTEDIDQLKRKLDEVFFWLPEHRDKTFQGMVAYVTGHESLKNRILRNGWYLVRVGDEVFELEVPPDFVPRNYTATE